MKILCFGNNDYDTDHRVSAMALEQGITNHGLVNDPTFIPKLEGYYHTTTVDLPPGSYFNLGKRFDKVILLDQPCKEWTHWKILLTSYKTLKMLESKGISTEFRNNENVGGIPFFDDLVRSNPSFCIYPWVLMLEDEGEFVACPKSAPNKLGKVRTVDWQSDPYYENLRSKMLRGEKIDSCWHCYYQEEKKIESTRQFETLDWVAKLDIKSLEDLNKLRAPSYYEIRFGNTCNLACRMCIPDHSHLIENEFKELKITHIGKRYNNNYSDINRVNIEELDSNTRVYFTGGEPTVFPEFYTFMQRCIDAGKTDFDFCLGYNGQKLSNKMIDMFSHFSNMNFSFSIDGYGKINDYIRSYSDWDTVIRNAKTLRTEGHTISLETIPSIYNAANLHLLFEFFDQEFPNSVQFLQIEQQHPNGMLSVFAHPDPDACVRSLERVKKTNKYLTDGRGTQSIIDSMYDHYANGGQIDLEKLRLFFEFNDKLDQKRGTKLVDYIPELEAGRKFLG